MDVGSGKAYLSQVMAAMHKEMSILAIDAESGNMKGAQKRSANLEVGKCIAKMTAAMHYHAMLML